MTKNKSFDFAYWASLAVTFFFVLSGFLITYLLLSEKKETSNISLKRFYKRRIYRILPLYYLIAISGVFILPHFSLISSGKNISVPEIVLFLFLLPNVAFSLYSPMPASHAWSIGVEEQFYLFWPVLIRYSENLLRNFIFVILIVSLLSNLFSYLYAHYFPVPLFRILGSFFYMLRIPSMAIGAIGAYFYLNKKEFFETKLNIAVIQLPALLLIITGLYFNINVKYINHEIYSALFLVIIVTSIVKEKTIIHLEQKAIRYFGTISYGFYMYQVIANCLVLYLFFYLGWTKRNSFFEVAAFYFLNFIVVLFIAHLSYKFFELPLMRRNKRKEELLKLKTRSDHENL